MSHDREMRRQVFHALFGVFIVEIVYIFGTIGALFLAVFLLLCLFLSLTYHQLNIGFVQFFIKNFERPKEIKRFPGKGGILFLAASLACIMIFERNVALASIMILALGDSISHLYGRFLGRVRSPWHEEKKLDGTVAGIIFATLGASFFVSASHALVGALIAMLIESSQWIHEHIDDNISVLGAAGIVLTLLAHFF